MHNAPSVIYPAGRSAAYGSLLAVVWLVSAVAIGLWCKSADALTWRQGLGLGALPLAAGLAAWSWHAAPQGELRWTGQNWLWSGASPASGNSANAGKGTEGMEGLVSVHLDWQGGLLLRFQPVAGATASWLWLNRQSHPARWRALRRAVYSPARMHANPTPDSTSMDSPAKP